MADTPNHGYSVPDQGDENWHVPLNENIEAFDTDIELRDEGSPGANGYDPASGAKYLDTGAGVVYVADGTSWVARFLVPAYDASAGEVRFGQPVVVDEIGGSLTGGTSLSTIAGNNLSIDSSGQLNASTGGGGGGDWTENSSLLEPADSSINGIGVGLVRTTRIEAEGDPLTLTVDGNRALELGPEDGSAAGNVVGGHSSNGVVSGTVGAVVGGGGLDGGENVVEGNYGTVAGGRDNAAGGFATVGGGAGNSASGSWATVAGGESNVSSERRATVAGGFTNRATAEGTAIGGGNSNDAGGFVATVGGGFDNAAEEEAATVGGGSGNSASGLESTIGGGASNRAGGRLATIAGGGRTDPGNPDATRNVVYDDYGTVGGGGNNQAGSDDGDQTTAQFATVSGGGQNEASATYAAVGGGLLNEANGERSSVSGGSSNVADGEKSSIGGGSENEVTDVWGAIAGGNGNLVDGSYATVAGGKDNQATSLRATVGGGIDNRATGVDATVSGGTGNAASGTAAAVAGGEGNESGGDYAFAVGRNATASEDGSFVVGDSTPGAVESLSADEARFQNSLRSSLLRTESDVQYYADSGSTVSDWRTKYDTTNDRWGVDQWDPSAGTFGDWADRMWVTSSGDVKASGSKDFVQTVDTRDGEREVHYTATESGTPHTEVSGVAELDEGRTVVELPDHFGMVTSDDEPLVVQTTPYGGSAGLKVVERSTDRLVVEDLDGEGNYEFAYTLKGTRQGYEDKQVVRESSPAAKSTPTGRSAGD